MKYIIVFNPVSLNNAHVEVPFTDLCNREIGSLIERKYNNTVFTAVYNFFILKLEMRKGFHE